MQKQNNNSLGRIVLYTGLLIQIAYILMTPFTEISMFILISTACMLSYGYIDLFQARTELAKVVSRDEINWQEKRKRLQKYYINDKNLDKSFSECLQSIQLADTHNQRISKILDNYQTSKKKFRIKLNRNPENRMDQYLQE